MGARLGQAVNRASDLVSRLRTTGRDLPAEKKRVAPQEELQAGIALLRALIPDTIKIETRISNGPCPIEADPSLIQDMILTLCLNARDAMPEGGRLMIGLERVLLEAGHPNLDRDAEPGEYACVSVRDTGQGMNWEVRGKAFEPFFTTKGTGLGTGLGLPMVQRIVKEHEGFINLESEVGEGTTFLEKPSRHEGETGKAETQEAPTPPSRKRRVHPGGGRRLPGSGNG